jgi:hypothetical protein
VSKQNKVNKGNYVQEGRLTPDDMARERIRQAAFGGHAKGREHVIGKSPSSRPAGRESSRPRSEPEE